MGQTRKKRVFISTKYFAFPSCRPAFSVFCCLLIKNANKGGFAGGGERQGQDEGRSKQNKNWFSVAAECEGNAIGIGTPTICILVQH